MIAPARDLFCRKTTIYFAIRGYIIRLFRDYKEKIDDIKSWAKIHFNDKKGAAEILYNLKSKK